MPDIPRWLARFWFLAGVAGVVVALVGTVLGVLFVRSTRDAAVEALATTDRSLATFTDTAGVLSGMIDEVHTGLGGVQGTLADSAVTITRLGRLTANVGEIVSTDVADSLDSVSRSMPGVISTASVVDRTMRALRLLGVDYSPEQPLDQALAAIEADLAEIPGTLRSQSGLFEEVAAGMSGIGSDSLDMAAEVALIRSSLNASGLLLDGYVDVAQRASDLVVEVTGRLESQARWAQLLTGILGLSIAAAMTLPATAGWLALGRSLPGAGASESS